MPELSDAELRAASAFILDVWRSEYKRLRRRPEPFEVVIGARVAAEALVRRAQGNQVTLPRLGRSPLFRLLGGGASHVDVAPDLAEQAALVLRYVAVFGDNPKATAASTDVDRRVLEAAVSMFRGSGQVNDTEAGRRVGISHSQARERKINRGLRVAAALHRDCPDVWDPHGRPVIDKLIAPDEGAMAWREAA